VLRNRMAAALDVGTPLPDGCTEGLVKLSVTGSGDLTQLKSYHSTYHSSNPTRRFPLGYPPSVRHACMLSRRQTDSALSSLSTPLLENLYICCRVLLDSRQVVLCSRLPLTSSTDTAQSGVL
jgi:hypothetical protein